MPEMGVADALGLAGRVQRVAEEDEPGSGKTSCDDVGGDAAAHRLTAEEGLRELRRHRFGDGSVTRFQPWLRVGALASLLGIREVEAQDGDATLGQRLADVDQ